MLDTLLDLGLSVLSGGATGLLGTAVSGVIDIFQGRGERMHELELRRLDIELARAEAASAERVAAVEAESARDRAEWEAMAASYREAAANNSRAGDGILMRIAEFSRRITRPWLTWAFVGIIAVIYFTLGPVDSELQARIIDAVLYVGTAASLWWFGQRSIEKRRAQGVPGLK